MAEIKSHRDFKSVDGRGGPGANHLQLAKTFPAREEYRLTSQMIRAAISIPANIAEVAYARDAERLRQLHQHRARIDGGTGNAASSCGAGKAWSRRRNRGGAE